MRAIVGRNLRSPSYRALALTAVAPLALGYGTLVQRVDWAQCAHCALVRSLAHGTPRIDPFQETTGDKAFTNGYYFYSVKAPGVAFVSLDPEASGSRTGARS